MSEEIKPVAYGFKDREDEDYLCSSKKPSFLEWDIIDPLYTKQQLQPRVKMTQAEFDEFQKLVEQEYDLYSAISEIGDINLCPNLYDRLFGSVDNKSKQNEFAVLWANFEEFEPQKTIEIIPEKKWFVRRILPNTGGNMLLCSVEGKQEGLLMYNANKEHATKFDTKEQAELWTNPLTESVLLPVGDEK